MVRPEYQSRCRNTPCKPIMARETGGCGDRRWHAAGEETRCTARGHTRCKLWPHHEEARGVTSTDEEKCCGDRAEAGSAAGEKAAARRGGCGLVKQRVCGAATRGDHGRSEAVSGAESSRGPRRQGSPPGGAARGESCRGPCYQGSPPGAAARGEDGQAARKTPRCGAGRPGHAGAHPRGVRVRRLAPYRAAAPPTARRPERLTRRALRKGRGRRPNVLHSHRHRQATTGAGVHRRDGPRSSPPRLCLLRPTRPAAPRQPPVHPRRAARRSLASLHGRRAARAGGHAHRAAGRR